MCFTGNPGTGKTTVAMRMATILHRLGTSAGPPGRVSATTWSASTSATRPEDQGSAEARDGGVLFIDEAYYLYRPENERDYGRKRSRS